MGGLLVVLTIVAAVGSRTSKLRQLVVETLSDRLNSDVELESFSVDIFPIVDIRGSGLVVRLRGAGDVPPLVAIRSFAITGGVLGLVERPRRFTSVAVHGMEINIPPGGPDFDAAGEGDGPGAPAFHLETLLALDGVLRLIPRQAGKEPREFPIHRLEMHGVGVDDRMPFTAELTNPVPTGRIRAEGRFGPWSRGNPAATPVGGTYVFDEADLSTIDGIGGMLASTGEFRGRLGRIEVSGETTTPDFHLAYAKKPLPLSTRFEAIVDGTDGDTHLESVHAELRRTALFASGAVVGTPGVKGRTVKLHVKIDQGRMEDLLELAVKSERPILSGRLALHTDFHLPPGRGDVVERLRLSGEFDLDSARFADPGVQEKLAGMSARARGKDPDETPDTVVTDLEGRFRLAGGTLTMSGLRFRIPGAAIALSGTYGLRSEVIELDGTLRMHATISEAAGGGIKGFFLKAIDPLFRRKGAGAVVPIRVRGTREDPKFGVDVVRALTPK